MNKYQVSKDTACVSAVSRGGTLLLPVDLGTGYNTPEYFENPVNLQGGNRYSKQLCSSFLSQLLNETLL